MTLFLIAFNVPIFLFGLKRQGFAFTVYSIFAVAVYSVMSFLIMNVLPIDVEFVSPLAGSDLLLCAIFSGIISGVGSGMTIRFGGAIDGIDVLSVMIVTTKALEISDVLSENFQSNGTIVNAIGGYSHEEKQIMYFIVNHFQINRLKRIVYEIDRNAFISLQDVSDIIKKKDMAK